MNALSSSEVSPLRRTASRAITPAAARGQQQGGEEGWDRSSVGSDRHVGRGLGGLGEHQLAPEGDVSDSRLENARREHPIGLSVGSGLTAAAATEELGVLGELSRREGPGQGGQRGWTLKSVQPAHRPAAGEGGGVARDVAASPCNLSRAHHAHGLDLGDHI
jgi:hypothetical protein